MEETASDRLLIQRALRVLNLQRDQLSRTTIEGGDETNEAVQAWVDAGIAAVDTRQRALTAFLGLSDRTPRYLVLQRLLEPLVLSEPPQVALLPRLQKLSPSEFIWTTQDTLGPERGLIAPSAANANANAASNTENNGATTGSRNSRPTQHKGPTFKDYGGVEALSASPTIIKLANGSYIEVRCDLCGGNTSWAHETFIGGIRGLQSHLRQVHFDKPNVEAVLQRCKYRDVSAEEAAKIMAGEQKIETINCQTIANVGRGTEYVGQPSVGKKATAEGGGLTEDDGAVAAATATAANKATPGTKKRRRGTSEPPVTHLVNCPVVVQAVAEDGDDGFIELRCDLCHGNGSYGSGKLLSGVRGFRMHFNGIHETTLSAADVLRRCHYRDVPSQEVAAIRAGNVSIGFIRCGGSAKVRPKASYKNFDNSKRT